MEKNEFELVKTNEDLNLRSFKEPTCDVSDEKIAKKQLDEFLSLFDDGKEGKKDAAEKR